MHPGTSVDLLNFSNPSLPGYYIPFLPVFTTIQLPLAERFRKSHAGIGEDILLAILALIAIGLFHGIVFSLLLQRRFPGYYRVSRQISFLCSDLLMGRPLAALRGWASFNPQNTNATGTFVTACVLVFVVSIADMGFILLTGTKTVESSQRDYSLKGMQPIATTSSISEQVWSAVQKQNCVTPMLQSQSNSRQFMLTSCASVSKDPSLDANDGFDSMSVTSWYHRGGSDHEIKLGSKSMSVGVRIKITALETRARNYWILFDTMKMKQNLTRQIHNKYAKECMRYWCEQVGNRECQSEKLQAMRMSERARQILLWEREDGAIVEEQVRGYESSFTFGSDLSLSAAAYEKALGELVASSVVKEVEHEAAEYENESGEIVHGIEGLASQEARMLGAALYAIVDGVLLVVLIVVKVVLRPLSFSDVAAKSTELEVGLEDGVKEGNMFGAETGDPVEDESYGNIVLPSVYGVQ